MPTYTVPAAELNAFLDACAQVAEGFNSGQSTRAAGSQAMIDALVNDWTDLGAISALGQSIINIDTGMTLSAKLANEFADPFSRLATISQYLGLSGVLNLEQWLTYLNTGAGGPNAALQHPGIRAIQEALSVTPVAANYYFEVLQGTQYPDALYEWLTGGVVTDGFGVSTSSYAGGVPKLKVAGLTGSGLVEVTGTEVAAGVVTAGKTWTFNVVANGTLDLASGGSSPATANALIANVSAISVNAGITAATIHVEAHRPSGRTQIAWS